MAPETHGVDENNPEKHPGLRLEELEKQLNETPSFKLLQRQLLQLKIDNLKNQIRAAHGVEELRPQDTRKKPLGAGRISKPAFMGMPHDDPACYTAHFGVVPVSDSMKRGLDRIHEGFARAKYQFEKSADAEMAEESVRFEAKYTRAFVEREALPQVIEIAKLALKANYQVVVATGTQEPLTQRRSSCRHAERDKNFLTYEELDSAVDGQLSRILPGLTDVYQTLKAEFGNKAVDYSGRFDVSPYKHQARADFLAGKASMLYTTYAIGGIALPLCDSDYPDRGIQGGIRPRVSIFPSPPASGSLLKHAVTLTWRACTKSDTSAVFLCTDSEVDVQTMQQKVAPLLRAFGASVTGETNLRASVIARYTDDQRRTALQDALAYAEGGSFTIDATRFRVRRKSEALCVKDWSLISFPPAQTAKYKASNQPKELTDKEVRAQYFVAFRLQEEDVPTIDKNEAVNDIEDLMSPSVTVKEEVAIDIPNSTASGAIVNEGCATVSDRDLDLVRESIRDADQKAMFLLAVLMAIVAFLISHNAPAGCFKSLGEWTIKDVLGLTSMFGLAVAAYLMLAVLYQALRGSDRSLRLLDAMTKPDSASDRSGLKSVISPSRALQEEFYELTNVCIAKYRNLHYGFWVGVVAAFISLLFLILSKRPHPLPGGVYYPRPS